MGQVEKKKLTIVGFPAVPFLILLVVILVADYTGLMGDDLLSIIAYLVLFGGILYEIGDRIPVFNKWVGGGSMLAMMLPSYMVFRGWIPENTVEAVTNFYTGISFQTLFICLLMSSSLLMIDRDTLIKSIVRYIPTLLAGIVGAAIVGSIVGMMMGYNLSDIICNYVLCIIVGALLNGLGNQFPSLTGDKKSLMRKSEKTATSDKNVEIPKATPADCAQAFAYMGAIYAAACICKKVMPKLAGASIHQYAWFVVILAILNVTNLVPLNIRSGMKTVNEMVMKNWRGLVFAGIGIAMTDWEDFMSVMNISTLVIALAIVAGAVLGTAVIGYILGMYPIDAAVTAGLCMANRGGGGDVVVLGAADRMELMSYAAISSRIGGAIVLVIASVIFGILY